MLHARLAQSLRLGLVQLILIIVKNFNVQISMLYELSSLENSKN
jgi:hypothetical protein